MPYADPKQYFDFFKRRDKARYRARKADGLCPVCGKPQDREGRVTCSGCSTKASVRTANRVKMLNQKGLCRGCGLPLDRLGVYCKSCCDKMKERVNVVYRGRNRGNVTDEEKFARYKARYKERNKQVYRKLKLRVFQRISGLDVPICVRCGCDYLRALEINHKHGGGTQIVKAAGGHSKYMWGILTGKIPTVDLEIACRVCNAIHYCEKKFSVSWKITYVGKLKKMAG